MLWMAIYYLIVDFVDVFYDAAGGDMIRHKWLYIVFHHTVDNVYCYRWRCVTS